MYSPTTRLLTVLELLQSSSQISGAQLARRLEVDRRTIRRYIVMLQDMGIPVEAERGPYGAYQLQRGHRLPPLMLTDAEAVALILGLIAIREFRFPVDLAAVEGALAKTERVLPARLLHQVRGLQEAITFNVTPPPTRLQDHYVTRLSLAVRQQQRVWLRYRAWSGDESERAFDPYGIVFNEGYWYTAGYCHLRQAVRTFRLDRIVALETLAESFERPVDFDVLAYVLQSITVMPGTPQIEVFMETTLEQARQVVSPELGTVEAAEGGVLFRRSATQLPWIAHFLLTLDFPVTVRQPDALRDLIRQIGLKAFQMIPEEPPALDAVV